MVVLIDKFNVRTAMLAKINELAFKVGKFDDEFRKYNYANMNEENKKRWNVRIINGKLYCNRLVRARNKKFRKETIEIVEMAASYNQIKPSQSAEVSGLHHGGTPSLRHIPRIYSS